ncbi:MAG: hypothetical protein ACI35P_01790 [Bacillus sp. (in: firmicutes)]
MLSESVLLPWIILLIFTCLVSIISSVMLTVKRYHEKHIEKKLPASLKDHK